MWQNTSGSTIYKELVVFLPFSLENAIHRCYFSLDASLTNWQRRETEKKSLRIIPLTMFWSAWMRFTFERPSWRCQSSSAPSFLHDCIKSVSFAQFIFLRFIWVICHYVISWQTKWIVYFVLKQHHRDIAILDFILVLLQHLLDQMSCHVFLSQLCHQHGFQSGVQIFIRGWQTLEQSHENIIVSYEFFQTNELIRKWLHPTDVVQQIIAFVNLGCGDLVTNKENVG